MHLLCADLVSSQVLRARGESGPQEAKTLGDRLLADTELLVYSNPGGCHQFSFSYPVCLFFNSNEAFRFLVKHPALLLFFI